MIAIISVLVALLLPAVQSAREAARRANCQSNMRNIALALLNYETANKRFPVGFLGAPEPVEHWAWTTFTLPYLEQQSVFNRLRPRERRLADLFIAAKTNSSELAPVQTPLSIFRCPSDTTPPLVPYDNPNKAPRSQDTGQWERHFLGTYASKLTPQFEPSTSNYVGSKGFTDNTCGCVSGHCTEKDWVTDKNKCANNGILYGESAVAMKHITDGASNTFLLGERDSYCLGATWIGVRNPPGPDMWGTAWVLARVSLKVNHPVTGDHNTCTEGFSSKHVGGAHFAFCDGATRFISDDIDWSNGANNKDIIPEKFQPYAFGSYIGIYQRLGVRNDGLEIGQY